MRNELENFWNQDQWPVAEIPDQEDDGPARHAVLACITHMIAKAFNNNIGMGLPRDASAIMTYDQIEEFRSRQKKWETAPEWTSKVPPLKETLKIPHRVDFSDERKGFAVLPDMNDPGASDMCGEKNILIWEPHDLFI